MNNAEKNIARLKRNWYNVRHISSQMGGNAMLFVDNNTNDRHRNEGISRNSGTLYGRDYILWGLRGCCRSCRECCEDALQKLYDSTCRDYYETE